jgi:hypothetical protein
VPVAIDWDMRISAAYHALTAAREDGDPLRIELTENALNDLLDRRRVALDTGNDREAEHD